MLGSALLYGSIAAGLYIIWFLVMRAFGLHENFRLRYLNFPILFTCTYFCLNKALRDKNLGLPYLTGLGLSMLTAGVSVVIYGAFFFIYLTFFDPQLLVHLQNTAPMGHLLTPMLAAFWTGHELLAFQVLYSIIVMEYFKLVMNREGSLRNVNMVNFAERPKRKVRGYVLLTVGILAIIYTVYSLINPETYPHVSGLLSIDANNHFRVYWAPIIAAFSVAFGIIQLSGFYRRRRLFQ